MLKTIIAPPETYCFHCGETCSTESILFENNNFCCDGCKLVYEILEAKDLCTYYELNNKPGISLKNTFLKEKFAYLDDETLTSQLLDFKDLNLSKVTFNIPQIHCSSCIWLLENLFKVNPSIVQSKLNFLKKEASITFNHNEISLREVVELLTSLGYEPEITLADTERKAPNAIPKDLISRVGIAGFCFGNIMLLSLPEYFSGNDFFESFQKFFSIITLILSLPVFFYCAKPYFQSAFSGIKTQTLNIDIPIALGFVSLFTISLVDIIYLHQSGYLDTFTGLVFFLLIGQLYQQKTFQFLTFDREYQSYFPISVTTLKDHEEATIPLSKLSEGMRIIVKSGELIPSDCILMKGDGLIDYSFVTGESEPIYKEKGDIIFAGGRQLGTRIELSVIKKTSQSYLTQLWNHHTFLKKDESNLSGLSNKFSKVFTVSILIVAVVTLAYWLIVDQSMALKTFTSILIIACPCAFALSIPFTLGNALRIFGKNSFYLKNTEVIERLTKADTIVFDKTGTLSISKESQVEWVGEPLSLEEKSIIKSVLINSGHPLSEMIQKSISSISEFPVKNYKEEVGQGVSGFVNGIYVSIGKLSLKNEFLRFIHFTKGSTVSVCIDGVNKGCFKVVSLYREGLKEMIYQLKDTHRLYMLSGDNNSEEENLNALFGLRAELHFNQSPEDKLKFIESLENNGQKVIMLGDGLNDAGALKRSYVGIAVTNDVHHFTPASDAILDGNKLSQLYEFISFSRTSLRIIRLSFIVSLVYNVVALSYAIQGSLTPLVSAILMPLSSATLVVFATLSVRAEGKLKHLL